MKLRVSPLILCAAALGPVLGVAVSASINTVPKESGDNVLALLDTVPQHEEPSFSAEPSMSASLPDHYPLVTPRGTIQVADLWLHGLYRNRGPAGFENDVEPDLYEFGIPAVDARPVPAMDSEPEATLSGEAGAVRDTAFDGPVGRQAASTQDAAAFSRPPLAPDQAPPSRTGPKVIDVAAVLAGK